MANFKVTYFFEASTFGWTENWYVDALTMQNALDVARTVGNQRVTLIGNGTNLTRIKITDVLVPGTVLVSNYVPPAPPAAVEIFVRDQPYNAIRVRCSDATNRYRRQVWLRGTLDDWIKLDPITRLPIINPGMTTQIARLQVEMRLAVFQMRVINKDPLVAVRKDIANVTLAAPNQRYQITTAAAHGFAEGQLIRIGKVKGENMSQVINGRTIKVNGVWNALAVTATTFQIALIGDSDAPPLYRGFGYAVQRQPLYVAISSLSFAGLAKRDTGRPFGLPVGRRSVRR